MHQIKVLRYLKYVNNEKVNVSVDFTNISPPSLLYLLGIKGQRHKFDPEVSQLSLQISPVTMLGQTRLMAVSIWSRICGSV